MDYDRLTDADLLARTAEDPEAFGVFYDRFEESVLAFVQRATRRSEISADITAEVFATALESAWRFEPGRGTARGWLFGIVRHELADMWERGRVQDRARRRLQLDPLALTDEAIERIEQLGTEGVGSALHLLDRLPVDQRAAISGRVLQERAYADLARELECSESVVRRRVSRGLQALRTRIGGTTQ